MDRFLKPAPLRKSIKTVQEKLVSADHLSLCPQKVEVGTLYSSDLAFTITLKPSEYVNTYQDQYKGTAYVLTSIFDTNGCKYTMTAELTKSYNIHYHGIMKIPKDRSKDSIDWFFNRLRKLKFIGRSECEQVVNYNKWTTYIMKDTNRDLEVLTIVKNDYGLEIAGENKNKD